MTRAEAVEQLLRDAEDADEAGIHDADEKSDGSGGVVTKVSVHAGEVPSGWPHRDGWLIFMRGGRLVRDRHGGSGHAARRRAARRIPDSADQAHRDKRAVPGPLGTGGHLGTGSRPPGQAPRAHRQRSRPAAQRALHREPPCRPPCHIHRPVTRHTLR